MKPKISFTNILWPQIPLAVLSLFYLLSRASSVAPFPVLVAQYSWGALKKTNVWIHAQRLWWNESHEVLVLRMFFFFLLIPQVMRWTTRIENNCSRHTGIAKMSWISISFMLCYVIIATSRVFIESISTHWETKVWEITHNQPRGLLLLTDIQCILIRTVFTFSYRAWKYRYLIATSERTQENLQRSNNNGKTHHF